MKKAKTLYLIMSFIAGMAYLAACGSGGSTGTDNNSTDVSVSDPTAPQIISILGDGELFDLVQTGIVVMGEGLSSDMVMTLHSDSSTHQLDYKFISSSVVTSLLPADITADDYKLVVSNDFGSDEATLSLLRGEIGPQGPEGPQGPSGQDGSDGADGVDGANGADGVDGADGADGISIDEQYICSTPTGDIDDSSTFIRMGLSTKVVKFTDGSFFIYCLILFQHGNLVYIDTSSDSWWYASDSSGVINGELQCTPINVNAYYSIANNTVTYYNQTDASQYETESCTQVYP